MARTSAHIPPSTSARLRQRVNELYSDRAQFWAQKSVSSAVTGANCLDWVDDSESTAGSANPLLRSTKPLPEAGVRVERTTGFEPATLTLAR